MIAALLARVRPVQAREPYGTRVGAFFRQRPVSEANRPESEKRRKKALPMTGGSGDSWTRTNDPIDVNDVLSVLVMFATKTQDLVV